MAETSSSNAGGNVSQVTIHKLTQNPTKAWETMRSKQLVDKLKPLDPSTPISTDNIRFVCISDTHSQIEKKPVDFVPSGDILLHAGDFTQVGQPTAVASFNTYLGTLPHKVKIVIAGNHDLTFDLDMVKNKRADLMSRFSLTPKSFEESMKELKVECCRDLLTECIYLQDSGIDVCGIKVYGSPWQPEFCDWGFNLPRGAPCLERWDMIPDDTDVLITHGPPIGHGDYLFDGMRSGCVELLTTIQKRVKPKFHVFGHIHEAFGVTSDGFTTFVNASTCTLRYKPNNSPIVFDVPIPEGHSKEELLKIPINNLNHGSES